ncbi:hypothetical protein [Streptomyces sp. A5-4]|uniref:hypothetical protein n=1 Tax=Streptomyces sp. A5-4 TaxID=3384771 RepID=UPI003DA89593
MPEAWGWRGRTLGQAVAMPQGPAWLRLACAAHGDIASTFWNGALAAADAVSTTIPRPGCKLTTISPTAVERTGQSCTKRPTATRWHMGRY